MAGSDSNGKLEASSAKEKEVAELRAAGYMTAEIRHRLPDPGQIIPTTNPGERVVFIHHFLRGLGFPLHQFVRGWMFFYGLDFHDLAPNAILNIMAFIIVCEAFLRVRPHFGLWLKTFNVKPKVVGGEHADCSGAMVSKLTNAIWPKGTFIDTVKLWQQGWFYITEPRGNNWAAAPEFRSGTPMRLKSWNAKGLDWGEAGEVAALQSASPRK
ncbi:uncharacterized protein [Triticum aestivum]|uniref:uncharacterized protein n=1 Tax=Triticum aestivum TaxID=4565 RepID=UPI0001BA64CE|nr:uncharacterized protein LOC123169924 [Triticum aestivum]